MRVYQVDSTSSTLINLINFYQPKKMQILSHLLPIIALALLAAGWVAIQFLAKKMGTKNHFDDLGNGCGNCGCGSGACQKNN
jgi:hypothetical protein